MDWTYKHFKHNAVFNAPVQGVLEAARSVLAGSFSQIEDTPDGFIARGHTGWHSTSATIQVASAVTGTQLNIELAVQRAGMRGYMLVDAGGYYNAQIDKWFTGIAERLNGAGEQTLVSKTTLSYKTQRGCLVGCLFWVVAAVCLGTAGTALDRGLFPQFTGSTPGPFVAVASIVAVLVGILAFIYIAYPENPTSRSIRSILHRDHDKEME